MKPFAFAELLARLRLIAPWTIGTRDDFAGRWVRDRLVATACHAQRNGNRGTEIVVMQREFTLLEYFARHKGEAVTRGMLGRDIWNDPCYALTNVIDVYINLLRKKLDVPGSRSLITTLRGIGYRMEE